jgi:hypothetical protein
LEAQVPTANQIDEIIKRNLKLFQKTGVTSVRPGYKARGGRRTESLKSSVSAPSSFDAC